MRAWTLPASLLKDGMNEITLTLTGDHGIEVAMIDLTFSS